MENKKTQRKQFTKVIAATSMCIFTLFACFSAAVAWFTGIRTQSPDGNGFKVYKDDSGVDLEFAAYKYDFNALPTPRGIQILDEDTEANPLTMNGYDEIFIERNDYTDLIMRVKMTGGEFKAGDKFKIRLTHDTSKDLVDSEGNEIEAGKLSPYISSTLEVKAALVNTTGNINGDDYIALDDSERAVDSKDSEVYDAASNYFKNGDGSSLDTKTFAYQTGGSEEQFDGYQVIENDGVAYEDTLGRGALDITRKVAESRSTEYTTTFITSKSFSKESIEIEKPDDDDIPEPPDNYRGDIYSISRSYQKVIYPTTRDVGYVIGNGSNYLCANSDFTGISNGTSLDKATIWFIESNSGNYNIYTIFDGTRYNLYTAGNVLSLDQEENNKTNFSYSTTNSRLSYRSGNSTYYLKFSGGKWQVATGTTNATTRYYQVDCEVVPTKYTITRKYTYASLGYTPATKEFSKYEYLDFEFVHTGEESIYLYFSFDYDKELLDYFVHSSSLILRSSIDSIDSEYKFLADLKSIAYTGVIE